MKLKNFNCMLQMLHSIFQSSIKGSLILLFLVFAIKGYGQVITIEDVSGNENDGAITLTATLTGGPVFGGFSVDVFTTDGTALVADNDYTAIVGQTLNFTGINGQTIAFDVFPTSDTNLEDSETLTISMGNLTGNFVPLDISDTATVTITNDDFGTISVVPRDTNEEGPINGRFRIVLSENNTTGSPLTLDYTLSGAAVFGAGNDYTVSGSNNAVSGTITFSATQIARNLNINPVDDSLVEGDEDVILTIDAISSPLFTMDPNTASITIADNDSPSITVTPISGNTTEALGTATFGITLGSEPTAAVTIALSSTNTDEGTVASTVVIPVANWDSETLVTVTGVDDTIVDGNQNYSITTGNVTSTDATYNALTGADVADVAVTNTDNDVYTPTLTAIDATAAETSAGNQNGTVRVDLGAINATGIDIVVNIAIGNSSSALTADYATLPTSVRISNGEQIATLDVVPLNDDLVEGTEFLILNIDEGSGYSLGSANSITAAVSIADNDTASLTIEDVTVNEDVLTGNLVFTVTLDRAVETGLNVSYNFAEGNSPNSNANAMDPEDYTGTDGVLNFTGNANEQQTITVPIINDEDLEEIESFTVQLGAPSNPLVSLSGTGLATGFIGDDDFCGGVPISNGLSGVFCDAISANLNDYTDTSPPAGATLKWVTNLSQIFNPSDHLSQSAVENITSAGSYFGFFYDAEKNCTGGSFEVVLRTQVTPDVSSVNGGSICGPGTVILSANATNNAFLYWYDSPTSTERLPQNGGIFITPFLTETTSFYVEAVVGDVTVDGETVCISERREVVASIQTAPAVGRPVNYIACNGASTPNALNTVDLDDRLLGGADAGEWSFVSGGTTIAITAENEVDFTGVPVGDYIFRYTTTGAVAPCTNLATEVVITVTADCDPEPIDIEILKTVNDINAEAGENVIFTITATNLSSVNAQNIVIADLVESGFSFVQSAPIDAYDPISGTWIIPELQATESATLDIELTVLPVGGHSNVAELLESFPIDANSANDTAELILSIDLPQGVDLAITNTAVPTVPLEGDEVILTLVVDNLSENTQLTQIVVSDFISEDSGFSYVSHNAAQGSYDVATGEWLIPALEVGENATLAITVTVPNAGNYVNTASILRTTPLQSDTNSSDDGNNSALAAVRVSERAPADSGFVYNQFSPNGDGINDFFKIQSIEQFSTSNLQIYDRYGNLVFARNGYQNDWTGESKNGESENGQVPDGTYFYLLDLGNGTEVQKGWLQIIR